MGGNPVISSLLITGCNFVFEHINPQNPNPNTHIQPISDPIEANSLRDKLLHQIDPYVDESSNADTKTKSPSLSVAVVSPSFSDVMGFGSIIFDQNISPTADTIYGIGSVSKAFNGLILAQHIVDERRQMNEFVIDRLPKELQDSVPASSSFRNITLRNLAQHYSGLDYMAANANLVGTERYSISDLANCLKKLATPNCLPKSAPSTTYLYSNYGTGLLGISLQYDAEKSQLESFHELLQRELAQRLGLSHTMTVSSAQFQESKNQW